MVFAARFHDGLSAEVSDVECRVEGGGPLARLVITEVDSGYERARWPVEQLFTIPSRQNDLKLGCTGQPAGARLIVIGFEAVGAARQQLPGLNRQQRRESGRQAGLVLLATGALASVIAAYLFGVPLLAAQIVPLVPVAWEQRIGDTTAQQMESGLADAGGLDLCDPNPNSVANRAIARFAGVAGAQSHFPIEVAVVHNAIPNAFALPGGRVYYFSALLDRTESADEMAGVLAHEIGHVVHRHAMEQLIANAGTGLLVGFVLGDLTGLSVAAALGATLVESRFSREAEAQADAHAVSVAAQAGFDPGALADLLERVAEDDDFSRTFALLSTHPLTEDRRETLQAAAHAHSGLQPAFTASEWQAIKRMCGSTAPVAPEIVPPAGNDAGAQAPQGRARPQQANSKISN